MNEVNYYGASDIGIVRTQNQDSILTTYNESGDFIAIVCDGVGGGNAGDVASDLATKVVREAFIRSESFGSDKAVKDWLFSTISNANDIIFRQSTRTMEQKGMGTTLVGILIANKSTYVFNVGDSRVYALYGSELICLTEDHNLAMELVKRGEVSEEDALHHPKRHMLTNALGIWNQAQIDIHKTKEGYEYLLICSDGLHGYVDEESIKKVLLKELNLHAKVDGLIHASKDAGGFDNVSVILIEEVKGNE